MSAERTVVYIDGFNLYYCALKDSTYKWLDLNLLCNNLLSSSKHQIVKIKYFSARISARPDDPSAPTRQDVYWRALKKYCPNIEIINGFFLRSEKFSYLAPSAGRGFVKTVKTEEKGSDVNLAVHMLNDAWLNNYDCAVMISNDSDMYESLRLIKSDCAKKIGCVYFDSPKVHISKKINSIVDFKTRLSASVLSESQLPDPIPGTTIKKPLEW